MGRHGCSLGHLAVSTTDRFVHTNGIRLHYLDHGGTGPTLVLAPGLTANAHSFGGLMRAGLGDVAHVLALDMRGRGQSDAPATGYTMEDHAGDVLGLLDALELERIVMGGHSFGGLLTYWLAANHPDRVERCVVIDAPAAIDPALVVQVQPSLDRLGRVYPSWDVYIALVRSMPYFVDGGWDEDLERYFRADVVVHADGTVQARCSPEHIEQVIEGEIVVDWPALSARIDQPTLLARAPGSFGPAGSPPLLTRKDADATAARMADCTVVDGVGNHITFMFGGGAQVLTGAVAAFLASSQS